MKIRGSVVSLSFIFRPHPPEDMFFKKKKKKRRGHLTALIMAALKVGVLLSFICDVPTVADRWAVHSGKRARFHVLAILGQA